ncbi:unannotated protein [freshwater metagenome]|uniref:Unannotated protein n=1 Tax=freshwater metagenome TaxID=449393 RepID=A0A6J6H068_9ZZZZ
MMQSPLEIPRASPAAVTEQTVGVDDWKEFRPPATPAELVTERAEVEPAETADIGAIDSD